ncbi:non-ribosomal peptide synthase domain TIGR01720/amino acid adenylation domain-containing protein, partial [Pedobacter terrae]
PVLVDIGRKTEWSDKIRTVKEQLREIPDKGISYGALAYLNNDEETRKSIRSTNAFQIIFNYLGQLDNFISHKECIDMVQGYGIRHSSAEENSSPHKIEIDIYILNDRMQFNWRYCQFNFLEKTIEELGADYVRKLKTIISHCIAVKDIKKTPSDFGLSKEVSIEELDEFLISQPIEGKNIQAIYPLSPIQEGMIFHSLYNSNASSYCEQLVCDLEGYINLSVLELSWSSILEKHTILRSSFHYKDFKFPVQCVHKELKIPFEFIDVREVPINKQPSYVEDLAFQNKKAGFNVDKPPLIRITVLRVSEDKYKMIWTSHHLLTDGWSMPILIDELLETYQTLLEGKKAKDEKIDSYKDYIDYLSLKDREAERLFWLNYLGESITGTLLPFVNPTKSRNKGDGRYKNQEIKINGTLLDSINLFRKNEHITLSTMVQGVWSFLLARYTDKEIVNYGLTVSGRPYNLDRMESRVGMFINSIPINTAVRSEMTVSSHLQELNENLISLKEFETTSLVDINRWVNSSEELFDTVIVFKKYPFEELEQKQGQKLTFKNIVFEEQNNYLLTIYVTEHKNEISLTFSYNNDLIDHTYVDLIITHFQNVLNQFLLNPTQAIGNIEFLAESELRLCEPNNESYHSVDQNTIDKLILKTAQSDPEKIAIEDGLNYITYKDLSQKASTLNNFIQVALELNPETIIGMLTDRGIEMITCITGIWIAGCAYLPLHPSLPIERIITIIENSGLRVLFYSKKYQKIAYELSVSCSQLQHLICVDQQVSGPTDDCSSERCKLWNYPQLVAQYSLDMPSRSQSDGLAYIIYTSGSTGIPKGAMIEHKGMLNHLYAKISDLQIDEHSIVAQNASQSFDISVWQMFAALTKGGKTLVYSDDIILDAEYFFRTVTADKVTILEVVPSYLAILMELESATAHSQMLSSLEFLIVTGETVSNTLVRRWFECFSTIPIVNAYGPTEASDDITHHIMNHIPEGLTVPIGKPIAGFNIYVVDREERKCPIGVKGELWVSGIGIGRGYINSPEKTEAVFMTDPFIKNHSVRLYRTGDMARYLPDGTIEFLGRKDNQIKIRGHRIELDEISSHISDLSEINETTVVHTEINGNSYIIAFVTSNSNKHINISEIRIKLSSRLPDYMVPSFIVHLESMPLTANGKIDKS